MTVVDALAVLMATAGAGAAPPACVDSLWEVVVETRPAGVHAARWCAGDGRVELAASRWSQVLASALGAQAVPADARIACAPAGEIECRVDAARRTLHVQVPARWLSPGPQAGSADLAATPATVYALDYRVGRIHGAPGGGGWWLDLAPRAVHGRWELAARLQDGAGSDPVADWSLAHAPAGWPFDVAVGRWSWPQPSGAAVLHGMRLRRASERARMEALDAGAWSLRGVADWAGEATVWRDGQPLSSVDLPRGRFDLSMPLAGRGVQRMELRQAGRLLAARRLVQSPGHALEGEWAFDLRAGHADGRPAWAIALDAGLPAGVGVAMQAHAVGAHRAATLQVAAAPWQAITVDAQAGVEDSAGESVHWHAQQLAWWDRRGWRWQASHRVVGDASGVAGERRWDTALATYAGGWELDVRAWLGHASGRRQRGVEAGLARTIGRWRTDARWRCQSPRMGDCEALLRVQVHGARWHAGIARESARPALGVHAGYRGEAGGQRWAVDAATGPHEGVDVAVGVAGPYGDAQVRTMGDSGLQGWAAGTLAYARGAWSALEWAGDRPVTLVDTGGLAGVPVRVDGAAPRPTGRGGVLLTARIPRYAPARVEVDPLRLPPGVRLAQRAYTVRGAGLGAAAVRLPITQSAPRPLQLATAWRQRIAVGTAVATADGRKGLVGHDGLVWLPGQESPGLLTIGAHACHVSEGTVQCAE